MIELKGIIQYHDKGRKHTDIVVARAGSDIHERISLGADVTVGRSFIESKLATLATTETGPAKWPRHIKAKNI